MPGEEGYPTYLGSRLGRFYERAGWKVEGAGYEVVGVSPDPPSRNRKFKEKEGLNFDLLSDEDKTLATSLGAWGEKTLYGKTMEGLIRSTFVLGPDGTLEKAYRNVKATGHVARLKEELLS